MTSTGPISSRPFLQYLLMFVLFFTIGLGINKIMGPLKCMGDEKDYHILAHHLIETGNFGWPGSQANRAPLYPVLIAGVYTIFGEKHYSTDNLNSVTRVMQSFLGAIMLLLAFMLAKDLAGKKAGYLTVVFMLFDSYWWMAQYTLMQENIFSVLILLSFTILRQAFKNKNNHFKTRIFVAGLIFGLAQLTKPFHLSLFPILIGLGVLSCFISRFHFPTKAAAIFSFAVLLVMAPWTIRNYRVFIPSSLSLLVVGQDLPPHIALKPLPLP